MLSQSMERIGRSLTRLGGGGLSSMTSDFAGEVGECISPSARSRGFSYSSIIVRDSRLLTATGAVIEKLSGIGVGGCGLPLPASLLSLLSASTAGSSRSSMFALQPVD